jgi:hypothetical protein
MHSLIGVFRKEHRWQEPHQVEIVFHSGPGGPEWEEYALTNAPALVVGDLAKFVGLAPSQGSLVAVLREAGLE